MKMGAKSGRHVVDLLFTLALFCVFAASALMVVLIGANVYQSTVQQMDSNFSGRTSLAYVATKIRQNDTAGGVRLEQLEGVPALALDQEIDGERFRTWIYFYEGALRETFTFADNEVELENGQEILRVADFRFEEEEEGLLRLTAVDEQGNASSQMIAPRCGLGPID